MFAKNKIKIGPDRLVYMAEVTRFGEGEIASVKAKKEEGGAELDTAGLVAEANKVIDDHEDQLATLPANFASKLHEELVNYFVQSPDRFEQLPRRLEQLPDRPWCCPVRAGVCLVSLGVMGCFLVVG